MEANLKQIGKYVVNMSDKLGSGSFGEVYSGFNSEEPEKKLAVKILNMDKLAQSENHEENQVMLKREIKILKALKSDYIAQMYDIIRTHRNLYMFLRFADGGDLAAYLKLQPQFRLCEQQAMLFFTQIVEGYKALYKKQIIHRDIKPANILIDRGTALLADFGLGKIYDADDQYITIKGTPYYRSPQLLKDDISHTVATNKCDVWSMGTMLYQMINGRRPWNAGNIVDYNKQIRTKPLIFNVDISDTVKNLIIGMLQIEEQDRFSWEQIFEHPAIKSIKLK